MKKIMFAIALCLFSFCSYSQDTAMNKKMENKSDKMNKKMENKTDKMNKKIEIAPDTNPPKDPADTSKSKIITKSRKKKSIT